MGYTEVGLPTGYTEVDVGVGGYMDSQTAKIKQVMDYYKATQVAIFDLERKDKDATESKRLLETIQGVINENAAVWIPFLLEELEKSQYIIEQSSRW